jgi:hypothetical protein
MRRELPLPGIRGQRHDPESGDSFGGEYNETLA